MDDAVALLRDPATIRQRCHTMLLLGEAGRLGGFSVYRERLDVAVEAVLQTIQERYPDLAIPPHTRWRHFAAGGLDRWHMLAVPLRRVHPHDVARIRMDLCVVSVLLDAGAGEAWRYRESGTGEVLSRSEGLAVASLNAFRTGLFSSDPERPLQVDAEALARLDAAALGKAFQVREDNPLDGLEGRAALLRNLAAALRARPDLFGIMPARPGNLFDRLLLDAGEHALPAREILGAVLDGLGPIWPGRLTVDGVNLGDVWHHPLAAQGEPAPGLVPFHKLSQWLTYSLIEVFEDAGVTVTGTDVLTGLPEYRNGGLFLDTGVLRLRHPALAEEPLEPGHPVIVEWRALTVALLDRVALQLRARLDLTAEELPLARVLEGGTWAAGRRLAQQLRGGVPPLRIVNDGTVF